MPVPAFTSNSGIGPLPRLVEGVGGSRLLARVFQSADLPVSVASESSSWVPLRALFDLFERSAAALGDDLLGLRVGQAMQPEDFGPWAQYGVSSPDVRGMIARLTRALRYHQSGGEFGLEISGELARWRYRVGNRDTAGRRHHADHALWPMLSAMRRYLGPKWAPIRIECSYERPRCWRKVEDAFGVSLRFNQAANAIVFERRLLDAGAVHKMPLGAHVTFADLRRMVVRKPPATIVDAARAVVRARIAEPLTDIEGTALLLGMGPRTLQRCLSQESLTFRDLLEQVRMERALCLLQETSASVTEIAFALGYTDATSFSRAYRRSTGYPPSHVRRASLSDTNPVPSRVVANDADANGY